MRNLCIGTAKLPVPFYVLLSRKLASVGRNYKIVYLEAIAG